MDVKEFIGQAEGQLDPAGILIDKLRLAPGDILVVKLGDDVNQSLVQMVKSHVDQIVKRSGLKNEIMVVAGDISFLRIEASDAMEPGNAEFRDPVSGRTLLRLTNLDATPDSVINPDNEVS
jgi:hypothetical protein